MRKTWHIGYLGSLGAALAVILILSGCGSSPSGREIGVKATEFRFEPDSLSLTVGEVRFRVVNKGRIPHVLAIEGPGVQVASRLIDAGNEDKITVKLEQPGEYRLLCPLKGHAERGMVGTMKVTRS